MQAGHTPCPISQGGTHALILFHRVRRVLFQAIFVQKTIHESLVKLIYTHYYQASVVLLSLMP